MELNVNVIAAFLNCIVMISLIRKVYKNQRLLNSTIKLMKEFSELTINELIELKKKQDSK